jgi:ABC-type sugar transport system substrate-binding protein
MAKKRTLLAAVLVAAALAAGSSSALAATPEVGWSGQPLPPQPAPSPQPAPQWPPGVVGICVVGVQSPCNSPPWWQ